MKNGSCICLLALVTIFSALNAEQKGKVSFWNTTGIKRHFFVDWRSEGLFTSCKDLSGYIEPNGIISKQIGSGYCTIHEVRVHGNEVPINVERWLMNFRPLLKKLSYNNESPETCFAIKNDRIDEIACDLMYRKETDPVLIQESIMALRKKNSFLNKK